MSSVTTCQLILTCCLIYSVIWPSSGSDLGPYCPPYERPVDCIDQCDGCEWKNGGCVQPDVCKLGCNCFPGYRRNDQNRCIPEGQCPETGPNVTQSCPPNEYPVRCIDRCQKCEDRKGDCYQIQVCDPGCNCLPGFWRDKQGRCIPEFQCPAPTQCPQNEYPVSCVNECQKCEDRFGGCVPSGKCKSGCDCVKGFWRNKQGKCIPEYQCPAPTQCPQNEYPVSCVNECQKCEDRFRFCSGPYVCKSGCNCFQGFWRNKQGRCVPEFQCPALPPSNQTCPSNEYPVSCINQCQKCEDRNNICMPTEPCKPGCDCLNGFRRNKQGKCIPEYQCPAPTECPQNEYPVSCVDECQKCEDRFGGCVPSGKCKSGCDCIKGFILYRRNKQGKCIPDYQCPALPSTNQTCPPNEYPVRCQNPCQKCEDRFGGCYPSGQCILGCDCIKGFFRNKQGKCVPEYQCPVPTQCPPNEYPVSCVNECQKCEDRFGGCIPPLICKSGCNCFQGFFRNKQGRCVPEFQCPECPLINCLQPCYPDKNHKPCPVCVCPADTCGVNEQLLDCGTACPPTCSNRNPPCTRQCKRGCFCKKGYIREKEGGKCIPESKCPQECPQINCMKGCYLDNNHKPCPRCVCPEECPQIYCREGCYLDNNHKPCPRCVCPEECPQIKCKKDCYLDNNHKPCPRCVCPEGPQCSIPKCDYGCQMDYTSKPCPSCKCGETD